MRMRRPGSRGCVPRGSPDDPQVRTRPVARAAPPALPTWRVLRLLSFASGVLCCWDRRGDAGPLCLELEEDRLALLKGNSVHCFSFSLALVLGLWGSPTRTLGESELPSKFAAFQPRGFGQVT